MLFMNDYEIHDAQLRFADHPILGPATRTLANLRDAANANSDGWAYWPKPARSAAKLMELLQREYVSYHNGNDPHATIAEYRKALAPVKAFRTRSGLDFEIEVPA